MLSRAYDMTQLERLPLSKQRAAAVTEQLLREECLGHTLKMSLPLRQCLGTGVQVRWVGAEMAQRTVCESHVATPVWELISAFSTQQCLKDGFFHCLDTYLRKAIQILSK